MPTVFETPPLHVYTIDAGAPFLPTLARGAIANIDPSDPFALADLTVYVPTRRAARALGDAFADAALEDARQGDAARRDGAAMLLPRILTLGDLDDADAGEPEGAGSLAADLDLPLAMSAGERLMTLARLVAAKDRAFSGHENWPAAIAAARELAGLLDSLYTEEIRFDSLAGAAPAEHAAHWEQSLVFLRIVTEEWPRHLAERGLIDPAERRAAMIGALADKWREAPPGRPTIVAGTTGSAPSVARLVAAVAAAQMGAVVLPGLDRELNARGWRAIDDAHPQAGLKALLARLDLSNRDVPPWPGTSVTDASAARRRLLSVALRPAAATDDWLTLARDMVADATTATDGLEIVEASNEEAEAAAIAIRLRDAIETPGQTAMLVTPNRDLARRVAAKMRRWAIAVDDSAGAPFSATPLGLWLRLVAAFASHPDDPVRLLALLDHPRLASDFAGAEVRRMIDKALRGPAPAPDMHAPFSMTRRRIDSVVTHDAVASLLDLLTGVAEAWPRRAELGVFLEIHATVAARLAGLDGEAARELWAGDEGLVGAGLFAELAEAMRQGAPPVISAADYPATFAALAASETVRARAGAHPRISILGPLEARLQHADVVILGGLNESAWPADATAGPFLSRAMRAAIGLPSPERRTGLAAHDFACLAAPARVLLTRSTKAGDGPTKPSRWMLRLQNVLKGVAARPEDGASFRSRVDATARFEAWAAALDALPPEPRQEAPQPRPPASARPRRLSVTRIEKLLRDPYAIYASEVLRLRKLDEPAEQFGARHLGTLLHAIFEAAGRRDGVADAEFLWSALEEIAAGNGLGGADAIYWNADFSRAIDRFVAYDAIRRAVARPVGVEASGSIHVAAAAGPFEIYGRADRIDIDTAGEAFIIDYKSGKPGGNNELRVFSPQLELLGLIAENGGFAELDGPRPVSGFEYFVARAKVGGPVGGVVGPEARERIAQTHRRVLALIDVFDSPDTPYLSQPRPKFRDDFGDYDVLARRREWADAGGSDVAAPDGDGGDG